MKFLAKEFGKDLGSPHLGLSRHIRAHNAWLTDEDA